MEPLPRPAPAMLQGQKGLSMQNYTIVNGIIQGETIKKCMSFRDGVTSG
jgi:hypothetical protein